MLQYLYTLQYSIQEPSSDPKGESVDDDQDEWRSCLRGHSAVYILAEKLDIPDLKQYSLDRFKITVRQKNHWNLKYFLEIAKSSLSMLPTSDSGLVPELLHHCAEQISKHPETLVSMNPVSVASLFAIESTTAKKGNDAQSMHEHWQDMLKENPAFTVALLRKVVQRRGDLQRSYDSLEKKYEGLKAQHDYLLQEGRRLPHPPAVSSISLHGLASPGRLTRNS